MYLLDTNIISETRRRRPHGGVLAWLNSMSSAALHISAVSAGEIQTGIELARRQDTDKSAELEAWLDEILTTYKVLPMSPHTFRVWAKLKLGRSTTLYDDAMIAATAVEHGLIVATRNVRDFEQFPVPVFNPFDQT